jgi:hypothetical protein
MSSVTYYTQFLLFDDDPNGVKYEGVVEFSKAFDDCTDHAQVEATLASYFGLEPSVVKLVLVSRLH